MSMFNYQCDEDYQKIKDVSQNYPQLTTFEKEWLFFERYGYIPGIPVELEYQTVQTNDTATVLNAIPYQYKRAILKGNSLVNLIDYSKIDNSFYSYSDGVITVKGTDTRAWSSVPSWCYPYKPNTMYTIIVYDKVNISQVEIDATQRSSENKFTYKTKNNDNVYLRVKIFREDTSIQGSLRLLILEGDYTNIDIPFFEGMQSVKMPVLTTSNEDGTKTNILTVNEGLTLRSNGDVYDELNLLTGRLTQRIGENNEVLAQEVIKTVNLTSLLNKPFEGTNHYQVSSDTINPMFVAEVPIVSEGEQTLAEINQAAYQNL